MDNKLSSAREAVGGIILKIATAIGAVHIYLPLINRSFNDSACCTSVSGRKTETMACPVLSEMESCGSVYK